jgi:hypothetical protein
VSLLTWERPSFKASKWFRRGADAVASPTQLTPLRMTIVGALLIAVGPLSMSL